MSDNQDPDLRRQRRLQAIVLGGAAICALGFGVIAPLIFDRQTGSSTVRIDLQPDDDTGLAATDDAAQTDAPESTEAAADDEVDDANPDILALTQALNYHPPAHGADYSDCHDVKAVNPKVTSQLICNPEPFDNCPYANDGMCTVSAFFVNGRMASVGFGYDYGNSDLDRLKQVLDKQFGVSKSEFKRSEELGMSTWTANWKNGPMKLGLLHSQGVNINGVPYDKVWLSIEDGRLPDPLRGR